MYIWMKLNYCGVYSKCTFGFRGRFCESSKGDEKERHKGRMYNAITVTYHSAR